MKKVLVVVFSMFLLGFVAVAQAADTQMPMSHNDMQMMNCPMMQGMSGDSTPGGKMGGMHPMMQHHSMMMHDMMQMMKDVMVMQKKILASPKPEDSMRMQNDLDVMIAKMDKMMTYHQNCMMQLQKPSGDQKDQMPSGQKPSTAPSEHQHQ